LTNFKYVASLVVSLTSTYRIAMNMIKKNCEEN